MSKCSDAYNSNEVPVTTGYFVASIKTLTYKELMKRPDEAELKSSSCVKNWNKDWIIFASSHQRLKHWTFQITLFIKWRSDKDLCGNKQLVYLSQSNQANTETSEKPDSEMMNDKQKCFNIKHENWNKWNQQEFIW